MEKERFLAHIETAKAAAILAGNVACTPVDTMLDDLAEALDKLHGTTRFMELLEASYAE